MRLQDVTFQGPASDDPTTLSVVPADLKQLLLQSNGFVAFGGGLHIRGASITPTWHSLAYMWTGEAALSRLYPAVHADQDVPFGQDCMGDQFLFRNGVVHKLQAEIGEVISLAVDLKGFLEWVSRDPLKVLRLEPLQQFQEEGYQLQPGQILLAYPPFCTKESASGVSLRAVPCLSGLRSLAELARHIRGIPDGSRVDFEISE